MKPFNTVVTGLFAPALSGVQPSANEQPCAPDTTTGGFFASMNAASTVVTGFFKDIMAATAVLGDTSEKSTVTTVPKGDVEEPASAEEETISVSTEEDAPEEGEADLLDVPGLPTQIRSQASARSLKSHAESSSSEPETHRPQPARAPQNGTLRYSELLAEVYEPDAVDVLLASAKARLKEAERREAVQGRIEAIVRWWKNDTSPPQEMLRRLETEMGDLKSVALLLKQLCDEGSTSQAFEPAMALVFAATQREDRSLHSLIQGGTQASRESASKQELEKDLKHVRKLLDACIPELNAQTLGLQQAFGAVRLTCACPPSRLRFALAVIQNATSGPPERALLAQELLAEMRYSHRDTHGSPQPMTRDQYAMAGARSKANGWREGGCQFASRLLVHGGALYLLSSASLPVRIGFAVLGTGLPQLYACWRLYTVESSEYKAHPSKAFTVAKVLSIAGPLLTTIGTMAIGRGTGSDVLMMAGLRAGETLAINAIGRIVRQIFQSWTQSPLTAGLSLVHADGIGLSAAEQQSLNCWRDALYVATSILLTFAGPIVAQEWLKRTIEAFKSANQARSAFSEAMIRGVFGSLNEMCDGWNPDVAKVFCKVLWGKDYVLQPGTQRNPGTDPNHALNQSASRLVFIAPADIFAAAAQIADDMGAPREVGIGLRLSAALWGGLLGALRGRVVNIVSTTAPLEQDGARNPNGLLSWATKSAQSLWRGSSAKNPQWLRTTPAQRPNQALGEDDRAHEESVEVSDSEASQNDPDHGHDDHMGNDADNR